jgi:magnesium-transporting ATPase (P-type)
VFVIFFKPLFSPSGQTQRQSSINSSASINASDTSSHRVHSQQTDPSPSSEGLEIALLVDGISLEGLWASSDLKLRFVECIQAIPTVIACRVSPLQKAALVRMIKASPSHPITLAIGDGANDVGMIHAARVGVGISGKEGRHAANSADFAISQFRFIVTLMFEHGRYNYIRCSKLVLYSFFKNLLLVSMLFYYCTYSGFSGTVPIDTIVFSGYNFYLGLPVLALGALDFDIPREDVLKYPKLAYATGRLGEMLNLKNMARWCIFAFIQGLLLFVVAVRFIGGPTYVESSGSGELAFDISGVGLNHVGTGWGLGMFPAGFLIYTCAVVSMQLKIAAMTTTPNVIFWSLWFLSYAGYFFFTYVYGLVPTVDWFNVVPLSFSQPQFWLALFLIPMILSITDYTAEVVWRFVDPSSRDLLAAQLDRDRKAAIIDGNSARRSDGNGKDGVALRALSNQSSGNNSTVTPPQQQHLSDSNARNPLTSSSDSGEVA